MAGQPPPLFYAEMVKSIHEVSGDLPEDFFQRVESGVDEATRLRLRNGFEASRRITHLRRLGSAALVGTVVFLLMAAAVGLLAPPYQDAGALAFLVLVGITLALYGIAYATFLRHRRDVHSFLAFVRAARGSSLGRDLG